MAILGIVFGTGLVDVPWLERGALVRDSVNFLDQNIALPQPPTRVTWQMLPHNPDKATNAGTDWRLIAVLEFEPAATDAIVAAAASRAAPADDRPRDSEVWFPDAVKDAMRSHAQIALDASDFYDGLYDRGFLWWIEGTDYLLLELYTK